MRNISPCINGSDTPEEAEKMLKKNCPAAQDMMEPGAEIAEYMQKNFGGKCEFNSVKKCDGLCNNCPFYSQRKTEKLMAEGRYIPDYPKPRSGINLVPSLIVGDYEDAILTTHGD